MRCAAAVDEWEVVLAAECTGGDHASRSSTTSTTTGR